MAWPTVVKKFLSYMSVFYFDLNLTAPEVTYAPPPTPSTPTTPTTTALRGSPCPSGSVRFLSVLMLIQ